MHCLPAFWFLNGQLNGVHICKTLQSVDINNRKCYLTSFGLWVWEFNTINAKPLEVLSVLQDLWVRSLHRIATYSEPVRSLHRTLFIMPSSFQTAQETGLEISLNSKSSVGAEFQEQPWNVPTFPLKYSLLFFNHNVISCQREVPDCWKKSKWCTNNIILRSYFIK